MTLMVHLRGVKNGCRERSAYRSTLPSAGRKLQFEEQADVAQLVEQLIRNQQVVSSSLTVGSSLIAVRSRRASVLRPRNQVVHGIRSCTGYPRKFLFLRWFRRAYPRILLA
jgi:hypothetical protein